MLKSDASQFYTSPNLSNKSLNTQNNQVMWFLAQNASKPLKISLSTLKSHKSALSASNKHSSKNKTQRNTYNNHMHPRTPPTLWSSNSSISTPQPQSNQISRHFICMHGLITYWKSIRLEMRLHKQEHIHEGIWTMLGVRWSSSPVVLSKIAHFQLRSHKQYGDNSSPTTDHPC
jgi:hypothetical protein